MNIGINGIGGRMGKRIFEIASKEKDMIVTVGIEEAGHPQVGTQCGGLTVTADADAIASCDCLIDFSSPSGTESFLAYLAKYKKPAVIGTTGLSGARVKYLNSVAKSVPIVFSPNMSVGVNVLFRIIRESARVLKGYDIYLEEAHHIHKKDAPSGTAKQIARIVNEEGFAVKDEDIVAIREDDIVGDHSIIFKSASDAVELSHSAKTRDIFVQGALRAARWVQDKTPGLYTMDDVLFGE